MAEEEARTDFSSTPWQERTFAEGVSDYIDGGGELRFLARPLEHFGETRLGDIDQAAMGCAASSLYPGAKPATIKRNLFVPVNAVINYAKPKPLQAPKGEGRRTVWLWPDQVERLIQAATTNKNPHLAAIITGLAGCGFRTSEVFKIDGRRDIHLAKSFVRLPGTKNGDWREVHLIGRVVAAWSTLSTVGQPGPLFRRFDGLEFKPRKGRGGQIRHPFASCVEQAGLDPKLITPHVMRHTWATWFYAVTSNEMWLKQQGGWNSNEYQRYTKPAPARLKDEVLAHGWHFQEVLGENWGSGDVQSTKSTA